MIAREQRRAGEYYKLERTARKVFGGRARIARRRR